MKKLFLVSLFLTQNIAFAAPKVAEEVNVEPRLFSPMMTDVFVIICFVLIFVLIGGALYLYMQNQELKERGKKINSISRDLKAAIVEIHNINAYLFPKEEKPASKGEAQSLEVDAPKTVKKEVWQDFIDAYNNLANSMEIPKADIACESFVKEHNLTLFKLLHKVAGEPPVFEEGDKGSPYWGYKIPKEERFAIVINPKTAFDEKFYKEGGLKESYASNFEDLKEIKKVSVKIPAIMAKADANRSHHAPSVCTSASCASKDDKYIINQPGLLRFS